MESEKPTYTHWTKGCGYILIVIVCIAAVLYTSCYVADKRDYRRSMNLSGNHIHNDEYERALGVDEMDYHAFLKRYGAPERMETCYDKDGNVSGVMVYFPGLTLGCLVDEQKPDPASYTVSRVNIVIITDKSIRFGKQQIGIGSTRDEIHAVYANSRSIDKEYLEECAVNFPEASEGYYGDFWCQILFSYGADGCVNAMAYEKSAHWQ